MIQNTDVVVKQVERLLWKHANRGKATFIPIYEERGVYNVYMKKGKVEAVQASTIQGGDLKALTKPLKECTYEELEQQMQRLKSSFQRQPRA